MTATQSQLAFKRKPTNVSQDQKGLFINLEATLLPSVPVKGRKLPTSAIALPHSDTKTLANEFLT